MLAGPDWCCFSESYPIRCATETLFRPSVCLSVHLRRAWAVSKYHNVRLRQRSGPVVEKMDTSQYRNTAMSVCISGSLFIFQCTISEILSAIMPASGLEDRIGIGWEGEHSLSWPTRKSRSADCSGAGSPGFVVVANTDQWCISAVLPVSVCRIIAGRAFRWVRLHSVYQYQ